MDPRARLRQTDTIEESHSWEQNTADEFDEYDNQLDCVCVHGINDAVYNTVDERYDIANFNSDDAHEFEHDDDRDRSSVDAVAVHDDEFDDSHACDIDTSTVADVDDHDNWFDFDFVRDCEIDDAVRTIVDEQDENGNFDDDDDRELQDHESQIDYARDHNIDDAVYNAVDEHDESEDFILDRVANRDDQPDAVDCALFDESSAHRRLRQAIFPNGCMFIPRSGRYDIDLLLGLQDIICRSTCWVTVRHFPLHLYRPIALLALVSAVPRL